VKKVFLFLLLILVSGLVAAYVGFGPPGLMAKTSTPDYCASCHVMEAQYEAWFHSGAHKRAKCVDCHLPNENKTAHYVWKSIDGMKDVFVFYSGRVPDTIKLTQHATEVLQVNCIRCHSATVDRMDRTRQCWGCHKRIRHKQTGAVETL